MSHTIIYSRLFIRMNDGAILPMFKAGDNNVYDVNCRTGRETRTKSWEIWGLSKDAKRFPAYEPSEIADFIDGLRKNAEEKAAQNTLAGRPRMDADKNFGYFVSMSIAGRRTTNTTFFALRNLFDKGVAKAISFEDYIAACGALKICWCRKETDREFADWHKSGPFRTQEELRCGWDEAATLANDGGPWISPVNDYKVDRLAALINAVPPRKGTRCARLYVRLADGTQGFLKSVYPFSYTENEKDAMSFSTATLDKVSILDVIPGADSAYYENVT